VSPTEAGRAAALPPDLPKAELHCHLEGTIPPSLAAEIATRNGIELPADLFREVGTYAWDDFAGFLRAYDGASLCLRSARDYRDITYGYLARCAAEGALYVELFSSPDHAAECGISYAGHVEGIAAAIEDAERDFGIVGRAIVTCVRHLGPQRAMAVADAFVHEPHPYFVGFGMGGDEGHLSFADFAPAFARIADAGYPSTVHAGEHFGPGTVLDALDRLPVTRIGHGVRLIEDPAAVAEVARRGVVLEICPGSNIALGLYPDHAGHPFLQLRDAGCRVTLNSDDPPFFHTTLGGEYADAARGFGLSAGELLDVTRTALEAAFIDDALRTRLLRRLDAWSAG